MSLQLCGTVCWCFTLSKEKNMFMSDTSDQCEISILIFVFFNHCIFNVGRASNCEIMALLLCAVSKFGENPRFTEHHSARTLLTFLVTYKERLF